jgi:hypothetical protein
MSGLEILVAIETVVLVLLAVLVVGLLRSHAEILRRLPEPEGARARDADDHGDGRVVTSTGGDRIRLPEHLPGPRSSEEGSAAPELGGSTLDGAAIAVSPASGPTLLAFLSSGCHTCRTFWEGLRGGAAASMPPGTRVVVVVKDPDLESPSRLRELAPPGQLIVQSSAAWSDYGVTISPYFLFVQDGLVRSEGAASSWDQVGSLLRDAIADEQMAVDRGTP